MRDVSGIMVFVSIVSCGGLLRALTLMIEAVTSILP